MSERADPTNTIRVPVEKSPFTGDAAATGDSTAPDSTTPAAPPETVGVPRLEISVIRSGMANDDHYNAELRFQNNDRHGLYVETVHGRDVQSVVTKRESTMGWATRANVASACPLYVPQFNPALPDATRPHAILRIASSDVQSQFVTAVVEVSHLTEETVTTYEVGIRLRTGPF